jgi:hypothetical protein
MRWTWRQTGVSWSASAQLSVDYCKLIMLHHTGRSGLDTPESTPNELHTIDRRAGAARFASLRLRTAAALLLLNTSLQYSLTSLRITLLHQSATSSAVIAAWRTRQDHLEGGSADWTDCRGRGRGGLDSRRPPEGRKGALERWPSWQGCRAVVR